MPFIACSSSIRCNSPLDDAIAAVKGVGVPSIDLLMIGAWAHVDVRTLADDPQGVWRPVAAKLADAGLACVSLNTGTSVQLHDRSPEASSQRAREIAAFVEVMKSAGIGTAAIQPLQRDPGRSFEQMLPDVVATVGEQVAAAKSAGVGFALELHVHSPIETLDEAARLLEALPDVPLVYDPTHFVMQGVDIRKTGGLMDHAVHVHCRDAAKGKLQAPFGEGDVDFDWLIGSLKDRGFDGCVSIEYLQTTDFDVDASVRRLYDRLQQW